MSTNANATPDGNSAPAHLVKKLRDLTGAGFSDCRTALQSSGGDIDKAVEHLRKKGQAAAQKKAQREATDGLVTNYIHAGGKIGVLLEVNCETDFVARTDEFQKLCHDVAMHIAALDPKYIRREDVAADIVQRELEIGRDQAKQAKKPEAVIEKIATGKLEKFYEDNCLYEQRFIKDESVTIKELIDQSIAKMGENVSVRRYVRMKVGDVSATYAAGAPRASSDGDATTQTAA
ncbi:MAG TPA: translation elongation factor Ts [Candidatus Acidoferrales bacterium]|nr:translation elongation factor Ts [Candidatus Acidoferrales bacterium]